MALIKKINLGQTEIEVYDDYIPTDIEKKKENLKKVYDVINEIAKSLDPKETKTWFLTKKQLNDMKTSGKYNFL